MKILHIGKYYPPVLGGMETVLRNLTEGLLDRSCDVTVLTAGDESTDREETVTGPESGRQGRLIRAGVCGRLNSQPLTFTLPGLIRREIAWLKPDLVHLHLPNPLAASAWLALSCSPAGELPPLAVWYHADITRQRLGRWLVKPIVDSCLKQAAGISVSSATLAEKSPVLARWRSRTKVIPFGIDPWPWLDVTAGLDGPMLFVGRLVPYKGLEFLIRAVARLPETELVVIGEGPLAEPLAKQADQAGCQSRIRFVGPMDQTGVAAHLTRARALVLPSVDSSETFGLVQLEAMAAGVPVIASDLPTGVREVGIPGETCLLVPPSDDLALAEAMGRLQDDLALARRLGEGGRRRFRECYSRDIMIDRLLTWYSTLIPGGRRDVP